MTTSEEFRRVEFVDTAVTVASCIPYPHLQRLYCIFLQTVVSGCISSAVLVRLHELAVSVV